MWQERERWRQRIRVGLFVAAVALLFVAWLRSDSDTDVVRNLLHPIDAWFSDSPLPGAIPVPARAGQPSADAGRGATSSRVTTGVGTSGATTNNGSRNYGVPQAQNPDVTVVAGDSRPGQRDEPATRKDDTPPSSRSNPCDRRQESTQESTDARQTSRTGVPPCDPTPSHVGGETAAPRNGEADTSDPQPVGTENRR